MLQTFKPAKAERKRLQEIAASLKEANTQLGAAKKLVEAAKEHFLAWLKDTHGLDLATLTIGDMVQIEEVLLIDIGKMTRFDEKAFSLAEPALFEKWKRELPRTQFKPLV